MRPRGFGELRKGLFIFRELRSTDNYSREAGEQARTFGDLGSIAKNVEDKQIRDSGRSENYLGIN